MSMKNLKNLVTISGATAANTTKSGSGQIGSSKNVSKLLTTRSFNSTTKDSKLLPQNAPIKKPTQVGNHKRNLQSTTSVHLARPAAVPRLAQILEQQEQQVDSDTKSIKIQRRQNNANNNDDVNNNSSQELSRLSAEEPGDDKFVARHLGPTEEEIQQMLQVIGYKSLEQLIDETIPENIRLNRDLKLPRALTEHELIQELRQLGVQNTGATEWRSFIGLGYYDCITPSVILRNIFENPGWTTAYTAYQAEIAQGRLESLMNYQTMVSDLTGLDVANASLLDEATAAAEAMQVCLRVDNKKKRNKFLVSSNCHLQTRSVLETRASALGVQVDYFDELKMIESNDDDDNNNNKVEFGDYCGVLLQYPNTQGHLFDLNTFTRACHKVDTLVVVATDLLACTLFKPPGDFEERADLAIGSAQRFGVPLNFGGPHAAFLACRKQLLRSIPGRVVGLTRDSAGNPAYRFALQTREQHIRRDKATSNICTAQALLANMSAMYAIYHGPEGLKRIAESVHFKTNLLARLIEATSQQMAGNDEAMMINLVNGNSFFDTLTINVANSTQLDNVKLRAEQAKLNLRYWQDANGNNLISISLDETTKLSDVFQLANLFSIASSSSSSSTKSAINDNDNIDNNNGGNVISQLAESCLHGDKGETIRASPYDAPENSHLRRQTDYLRHPTFNSHHSEAKLVRYMKQLENKDISLAHSMIPLGSCTMKLNATSQMIASSWPEFAHNHPFQPRDQSRGYQQLFNELETYLCEITGYDRVSLQPNSGAQGEYAGLRAIKSYLESCNQHERNVCLIPISAHGTNPASAQMAGFQIQTVKVNDEHGNIDMEHLREQIAKHRDHLACLMITYPSTFGVFEENVREVCDLVHEAGGQVYLDGANMNAQVGLCRPGDYGSDVSHLNLHKTFCIPHGGGGPGAGPIGVKAHLAPFLPSHPLCDPNPSECSKTQSFGTVSASAWGSPVILPISWSYIRLMGKDLAKSSQLAILNANYMRSRLENDYKILFRGKPAGNVAHEFIIDCRPFKKTTNIEAIDIAKRLQDFGFHAPTVSWPVANTLMLEPTESEDKQQLDNYCDALLQIRKEIAAIESGPWSKESNPIKGAPHTQQVVCSSNWKRDYTREQAAFPSAFVKPETKIWPTVGRVDDTYGDTNLFCTCPPPTEHNL